MIKWGLAIAIALIGIVGPIVLPAAFDEGEIDSIVQRSKERLGIERTWTTIVELKGTGYSWPIDRATLAKLVSAALADGAIAVGIDIDMSIATDEDASLQELVRSEKRVVPLRLPQTTDRRDALIIEGFVFDDRGSVSGVRCADSGSAEGEAFALRIALAAGLQRKVLHERCSASVLKPYIRGSLENYQVLSVTDMFHSNGSLRGQVAILGTTDSFAGLMTYNGIKSTALINASVVDSALQNSWRQSNVWVSSATYAAVLAGLGFAARRVRSTAALALSAVAVLVVLLAVRLWVWFPILPIICAMSVIVAWGPVRRS
jgi:CHASE2 domain-containing sensor protein